MATPAIGQSTDEQPEVNVSDYGTVDLAVQDTDLAQVLQMLAIQSKKNIIASKSVSATVTANLFDVTFTEALDSILKVNGFAYREDGNFIYVYTIDEIQAIERAQRTTESRIYELQYLSAADAQEFITPLLSDVGQSSFLGEVQLGFKPDIGDGGADSYAYAAKLVVNDYADNLESIGALLAEVDTPPEQVLVEATILQTLLDESNAWGVDFSVIANMDFTDLSAPLAAVNALIAGDDEDGGFQPPDNDAQAIASTVGNTAGPGGFKVGVITNDVSVFVRILDEVADTTVLARPKIMALNRQRAEVLVGARVGYLSTTATQTTTTQTVEFLDTGIQLIFRPFISPDGMIRMELAPSVSEASLRTVTDANGLIVTIPDELTNELTTNVRIRDGETLVLGGLFRESTRVGRRQIPFLGDIPVLGIAFRGQDDTVERDEIIFLITPTIMKDEVLWEMGEDTLAVTDALRVGARNGLLIFSRERRIGNYNRDAVAAYRAGDTGMALHYVNKSLSLDRTQPQMIELRAKITGQKIDHYEHSIMERILRESMGSLLADEPTAFNRMSTPPASLWRDNAMNEADNEVNNKPKSDPEPHAAAPADSWDDELFTDGDSWIDGESESAESEPVVTAGTAEEAEWESGRVDPWADDSSDDSSDYEPANSAVNVDTDEPMSSSSWDAADETSSVWDSATTDFDSTPDTSSNWTTSSSNDARALEPLVGSKTSNYSFNDFDTMVPDSNVMNVSREQYFTQYFRCSIFGFWLPAEPGAFNDVAGVSDFNITY